MGTVTLGDHPPAPLQPGRDVLGQMLDAGLPAMYLCMAGGCGRCRMRVLAGGELLAPPNRAERAHGCDGELRLACQAQVVADGALRVRQ